MAFMAWSLDDGILEKCASGGVFDALAAIVIEYGGVVFGAAVEPSTQVLRHVSAEDTDGIAPMRLSKYYQSEVRDTYTEVKRLLLEERWVLYTGTPCQIAGLYASLGERLSKNPHLLTMEVLCHGVTSKQAVDSYVASKERRLHQRVTGIKFRTKDGPNGWEDSSHAMLQIESGHDVSTFIADKSDTFMVSYGVSLFMRESCYRCKYCSDIRVADYMAGDFWGVGDDRADDAQRLKGVSLLLVSSEKGQALLPSLEDSLYLEAIELNEATPRNSALYRPTTRNNSREVFFSRVKDEDFDDLVHRLLWKVFLKRWAKSHLPSRVIDLIRRSR